MTIYFHSPREVPYGCFSNFSPHGFHLDGKWWPTGEHYYQAQKFVGTPYAERIRAARSPQEAADLGQSRAVPLRLDWDSARVAVMRRLLTAKFSTHAQLREILLATGDEPIVEDSPSDYYWGCGKHGTGKNVLGRLLVEVRDTLRSCQAQATV